jgi:hypothetical protein
MKLLITFFALLVRLYEAGECGNACFALSVSSGSTPSTQSYTYSYSGGSATFG